MLVIFCIWHSVIASIVFLNPEEALTTKDISPTNIYVKVDRYVFVFMFVIYFIIHILLIIWLISVPYKRRREMEYLDREYAAKKHIQLYTKSTPYKSKPIQSQDLVFRRTSSTQGKFPSVKSPIRPMKHSDGVTILANATTFLPIKEEVNEAFPQTMELNEQDDVFYDHTNDINDELKNTQLQPIKNV